jgi:hypothetical protein
MAAIETLALLRRISLALPAHAPFSQAIDARSSRLSRALAPRLVEKGSRGLSRSALAKDR